MYEKLEALLEAEARRVGARRPAGNQASYWTWTTVTMVLGAFRQ